MAFTEDHISSVLNVVAKETARSTQDVKEKLIKQASQLYLGPLNSQAPHPSKLLDYRKRKSGSIGSGHYSDTSGAIRSDDDFSSIGYSLEDQERDRITDPPRACTEASCSRIDQESEPNVFDTGSPGGQTLAALKAEAIKDKNKRSRNRLAYHRTKDEKEGDPIVQNSEWGLIWKYGLDADHCIWTFWPRWNPYKFYRQICKANISICGKGAREILCHHSTEKHLQKDHMWRYEYLTPSPRPRSIKSEGEMGIYWLLSS